MGNTVEVVIKLDETIYHHIVDKDEFLVNGTFNHLLEAINNGTVLLKGHGRLIDADALWDAYHANDYDFYEALDYAHTMIEADKAKSEE